MSPYPTVVIVTTVHQNEAGMELKFLFVPSSTKNIIEENITIETKKNKIRNENSLTDVVIVYQRFLGE